MTPEERAAVELEVHPVTPDRWDDLVTLFGPSGAYSGCWCMWWRITRREFDSNGNEGNKRGLRNLVDRDVPPGLLGYVDEEPAIWCSIEPREAYPALERSRTLKRVDDKPVWSIVCFFVGKPYRGRGMMLPMLRAAMDYAAERGALIVEGYPIEIEGRLTGSDGFTGVASVYRAAGFEEVARPNEKYRIMRWFAGRG